MEREIEHKVNGEMRTDVQYHHRIVVVAVVSTPFPIPLGLRFQKNGEGEVACALALLQDLDKQLGRRFLDVLVGDALYMQAPFVKEVERLDLAWAFTLKENQPICCARPNALRNNRLRAFIRSRAGRFDMGTCRRLIAPSPPAGCESSKRFASNICAASVSAKKTVHQFSRSRWRIDTEVFQTIATSTTPRSIKPRPWWADHVRFLAYTLSLVFYHRQVRSHARGKCKTFHECAKSIAYWFVAPAANTS
jgi:hypothetical protein